MNLLLAPKEVTLLAPQLREILLALMAPSKLLYLILFAWEQIYLWTRVFQKASRARLCGSQTIKTCNNKLRWLQGKTGT